MTKISLVNTLGLFSIREVWLMQGGLTLPRPSGWAHGVVDEGACMQASKEQKKYRRVLLSR